MTRKKQIQPKHRQELMDIKSDTLSIRSTSNDFESSLEVTSSPNLISGPQISPINDLIDQSPQLSPSLSTSPIIDTTYKYPESNFDNDPSDQSMDSFSNSSMDNELMQTNFTNIDVIENNEGDKGNKDCDSKKETNSLIMPITPLKPNESFNRENHVTRLQSFVESLSSRSHTASRDQLKKNDVAEISSFAHKLADMTHNSKIKVLNSIETESPSDQPLDLSTKKRSTSNTYLSDSIGVGSASLLKLQSKFGENSPILSQMSSKPVKNVLENRFPSKNEESHNLPLQPSNFNYFEFLQKYYLGQTSLDVFFNTLHNNQIDVASQLKKTSRETIKDIKDAKSISQQNDNPVDSSKYVSKSKKIDRSLRKKSEKDTPKSPLSSEVDRKNTHTLQKCSCGVTYSSLFQLTCHIEETGHTPEFIVTNSTDDLPKLVRGQDIWITQGPEQAELILRCIQCRTSFRSLPDLTVHMVKTKHYINIVKNDTNVFDQQDSKEVVSSWTNSLENESTNIKNIKSNDEQNIDSNKSEIKQVEEDKKPLKFGISEMLCLDKKFTTNNLENKTNDFNKDTNRLPDVKQTKSNNQLSLKDGKDKFIDYSTIFNFDGASSLKAMENFIENNFSETKSSTTRGSQITGFASRCLNGLPSLQLSNKRQKLDEMVEKSHGIKRSISSPTKSQDKKRSRPSPSPFQIISSTINQSKHVPHTFPKSKNSQKPDTSIYPSNESICLNLNEQFKSIEKVVASPKIKSEEVGFLFEGCSSPSLAADKMLVNSWKCQPLPQQVK